MEILKIELFLAFGIFTLMRFQVVQSFCTIRYPLDAKISPIYAKVLGKYTIYLPYNGKDLQLYEGETIQGYCRTKFDLKSRYEYYDLWEEQSSISINCVDSQLHYNDRILEGTELTCNKLNWSIYDTSDVYDWCEKNENSKTFLLAAKSSNDHHILAGICFNLKEWSLQTITHNLTNSDNQIDIEVQRDITKSQLKGLQSLGNALSDLKSNYFDFTQSDLNKQLAELSQTNSWLVLADYELSSIVQGESFKNYFNEFVNTLDIVWWPNLRLGNWKNFLNTLENYSQKNSFQIYTGTSGAVKIPGKKMAENNILEIQIGYLNKTVPSYIWSYITSIDGQNEDFIIVGYNSPFAEWFGISEVIFCPDICSEILWLKEITSSFRYATAGIMFCCSPDFVRQTSFLHGFPNDVLLARSTHKPTTLSKTEGKLISAYDVEDSGQRNAANEDSDETLLDV